MSVPAFVMKIFVPLIVHSPSRQLGARARGGGVGSGSRLGQAEGGQLLPGGEVGEPVPLLVLGAEEEDRHRPERAVRRDRDRDRRIDSRQLLDRDRVRDRVGAAAAVLLGNGHAHQPELGQLRDEVVGEAVLPVELLGDRGDLLLGEVPDRAADELLLLRQVEVHAESRSASSTIRRTPYPVPPFCQR